MSKSIELDQNQMFIQSVISWSYYAIKAGPDMVNFIDFTHFNYI